MISAVGDGVWIANISRTHALYTEGDGYRIRLPRMEDQGEPSGGWFLRAGMTLVGSRAMLDEGQPLCVMVNGQSGGRDSAPDGARVWQDGDATLLPLYLDPMTKIFPRSAHVVPSLAARPGRGEPAAAHARDRQGGPRGDRRLPRAGALRHRPRVPGPSSARVAEHIKVLRRKITDRGLVRADTRLSDEVVVRVLIEHGIITAADLGRLNDPAWCSRQEDLWWTQAP